MPLRFLRDVEGENVGCFILLIVSWLTLFQLLMQRFLPTLVSIFQAPPEKTPIGINAVSIAVHHFNGIVKMFLPFIWICLYQFEFPHDSRTNLVDNSATVRPGF